MAKRKLPFGPVLYCVLSDLPLPVEILDRIQVRYHWEKLIIRLFNILLYVRRRERYSKTVKRLWVAVTSPKQ